MNPRLTYILPVLYLGFLSVSSADPLRITNVRINGSNISLSWTAVTDLCIVARSPSLSTGRFEFVGDVLSTPHSVLPATNAAGFYRIRQVEVVSFPDPQFGDEVRSAIPRKHAPTNEMYNVDFVGLTELRASNLGITSAEGIEWLTDLTFFECYNNNLTSLNLSANTGLISLYCDDNDLTNLNLSACASLEDLSCYNNYDLTSLDLSACMRLKDLYCYNDSLTSLDLPASTNLTSIGCSANFLTNLDLSANTGLKDLNCNNNSLTNLNLSANANLTYVDCRDNPILEIIVADTAHLPAIFLYSGNPIIREP